MNKNSDFNPYNTVMANKRSTHTGNGHGLVFTNDKGRTAQFKTTPPSSSNFLNYKQGIRRHPT